MLLAVPSTAAATADVDIEDAGDTLARLLSIIC